MSKRINVNPNFYKVGGREHAEGHGEVVIHKREKQQFSRGRAMPGSKKTAPKRGKK
jgi:hypothetical protein